MREQRHLTEEYISEGKVMATKKLQLRQRKNVRKHRRDSALFENIHNKNGLPLLPLHRVITVGGG